MNLGRYLSIAVLAMIFFSVIGGRITEKEHSNQCPARDELELEGSWGPTSQRENQTSENFTCRLMLDYDLTNNIVRLAEKGLAIMGTCAGTILLANDISDARVKTLGLMDITVRRNAFGRQKESFEAELSIPVLGDKSFPGVFIRAPIIERVDGKVAVLTRLDDGTIVAARQGKLLATAFHPELTDDLRVHKYFADIIEGREFKPGGD